MKRISVILAILGVVACLTSQVGFCAAEESKDAAPLSTLEDYLRYAAMHSSGLRSAFENWKAAIEQIPQAKALPDPRFTYSYFIREIETRVGPQKNKFGISQVFPWFGKIEARTDAAAAAAKAAEKKYHAVKLELFYRVKDAYYEFVYLKRAIEIAEQNLELLKHFEEVARIKYTAGGGTHPDVIRAQIELAILEDRLASLEQLRSPLVAKLNSALSRPEGLPLDWPKRPEFRQVALDRKRVMADMRSNNPQLAQIDFEIAVARSMVTLAKKRAYPDVTLGVDWIQTGSAVSPGVSDSGRDPVIAMLSVNLPIWGSSNKAAERQAKRQLAGTSAKKMNTENKLIAAVAEVLYNFEDSNRKIKLYRNILVPKAKEMLNASEVAYRAGEVDFLSLVDAQRKLLSFELLHERALTDHQQRFAEVQKYTASESIVVERGSYE